MYLFYPVDTCSICFVQPSPVLRLTTGSGQFLSCTNFICFYTDIIILLYYDVYDIYYFYIQFVIILLHLCLELLLSSLVPLTSTWTPLEISVCTFVGNPWVKVYPTMYFFYVFILFIILRFRFKIYKSNRKHYSVSLSCFC